MLEVTLRVRGIDLDDEKTDQILATNFADTIWAASGKLVTVSVFAERHRVVDNVVHFVRQLASILPGVKVEGVYRELVSTTDVAHRVDISREGARKWSEHPGFPEPVEYIETNNMKLWAWAEVVDWMKQARGVDLGIELPSAALVAQIENCIHRNPDHTTVHWNATNTAQRRRRTVVTKIQPNTTHKAGDRAHVFAPTRREVVGAGAR